MSQKKIQSAGVIKSVFRVDVIVILKLEWQKIK